MVLYNLSNLSEKLEDLAIATGTKRKISLVTDLLKLATPLEAKYIVKLLAGDLRIGLKEGAVEDAIARLFKLPVDKIGNECRCILGWRCWPRCCS